MFSSFRGHVSPVPGNLTREGLGGDWGSPSWRAWGSPRLPSWVAVGNGVLRGGGRRRGLGLGREGEFGLFWPIHSPEGDLGRSSDPSGLGLAIEKTRELDCVRRRQSGSPGSPSLFGINSHPSSWAILPFPFLLNQGLFWKLL